MNGDASLEAPTEAPASTLPNLEPKKIETVRQMRGIYVPSLPTSHSTRVVLSYQAVWRSVRMPLGNQPDPICFAGLVMLVLSLPIVLYVQMFELA
jgi:hypothetical protein